MIISHKHKFIFLKPGKTAGTSIEIALAKHCGDEDIVTPLIEYSDVYDSEVYTHKARNYQEKGYYNHINPDKIEKMIGSDIWNTYFKFTVVRNPWDLQVSWLCWRPKFKPKREKFSHYVNLVKQNMIELRYYFDYIDRVWKKITKQNFIHFDDKFIPILDNSRYYFDRSGKPICDFYIRYENLEEGYQQVCHKLDVPYEKLPLTKNKTRKREKHYSQFYNEETKQVVAGHFKKETEYFDYKFEAI